MDNLSHDNNYKFLKLLSEDYPDIPSASAEIIRLNAILRLPKGTEHFMSDIHGEYEAFNHILKNASGAIRRKIDERLGDSVTDKERRQLAALIYYPEQKLRIIKDSGIDMDAWYEKTILRLAQVCRYIASKYTRNKVRAAMNGKFSHIIDELLNIDYDEDDKENYYREIVSSVIKTDSADCVIADFGRLISRLCIDRLHIVGDVFDRGPGAEKVMDILCGYHSVDIQWGNHDILWMGAAAGSEACIANVIRLCTRYNNTDTLEDGYGISLRPISTFALETYRDDPCTGFMPIDYEGRGDAEAVAKINKAITVIQFKLEGQILEKNPEFCGSKLLEKIDFHTMSVNENGRQYPLADTNLPTVDPEHPNELTAWEANALKKMKGLFLHSERLQKHVRFLYDNGSMYTCFNGNLLYHGCIPMTKDGDFMEYRSPEGNLSGKKLFDYCDRMARRAYFGKDDVKALDFMWYLWCGSISPLFGKNRMTTLERSLLSAPELAEEIKNSYYRLYDHIDICKKILREFGLDEENSHIINGHVPVRIKQGESPIKGGGKLLVIDGGLSKPYQAQTGIAGYTLIYNSFGLHLVTHEPFESAQKAIDEEKDIHSVSDFIEKTPTRLYISDTDAGARISVKIRDLQNLIDEYRNGTI